MNLARDVVRMKRKAGELACRLKTLEPGLATRNRLVTLSNAYEPSLSRARFSDR